MNDYWLGVLTIPMIAVALLLIFVSWVRAVAGLERHGVTFESRWHRNIRDFEDDHHWQYVLRHGIWWERSWGPVFIGGWYREPPKYQAPSPRLIGRWIGFGSSDGPCISVIHTRNLGNVRESATKGSAA